MEAHGKHASKPDGLQTQCNKCRKANRDKPENKERKNAYNAAYHEANKEEIAARNAAYRAKPEIKERKNAYNAAYYEANKEEIVAYRTKPETKKKVNAWTRERRKNDPVFRARRCLRNSLHGFLNGTSKCERTQELLGCSYEYFVEYQLATSSPEVLAAAARGEKIEYDHIIPLAAEGIDPRIKSHRVAMCHYTNVLKLEKPTNGLKSNHTPKGFNRDAWLEEQTARIAACEGKTPMETIEQNREYIATAHAFQDLFRA
jgi:hypothetical protein